MPHLYWRIHITANGGGGFHGIDELEFRATPGGVDQAIGGTATASSEASEEGEEGTTVFPASDAFDDNTSSYWKTEDSTVPAWIQYQFASAVDVAEVAITSGINFGSDRAPNTFTIEYSDDGLAWTVSNSLSNITGWDLQVTKLFPAQATVIVEKTVDRDIPLGMWHSADRELPLSMLVIANRGLPIGMQQAGVVDRDLPIRMLDTIPMTVDRDLLVGAWHTADRELPVGMQQAIIMDRDLPIGMLDTIPMTVDRDLPLGAWHLADRDLPIRTELTEIIIDRDLPIGMLATVPMIVDRDLPILMQNASTQKLGGNVRVFIGRRVIAMDNASVSGAETSPYLQCSITLKNPADYHRFRENTPFSLEFYGDSYVMIVDTRAISRSKNQEGKPLETATITGLSPLAALGRPRAQGISALNGEPTMAKAIVEDLLGQPVTWNTINWLIPGSRFGVDSVTPLEAARQITGAVKAVVQSAPDGSVIVRPLHPISPTKYKTAIPDLTIAADDITGVQERIGVTEKINRLRISDGFETAHRDSMEFHQTEEQQGTLQGIIRTYPDPQRQGLALKSSRAGIKIQVLGQQIREVTERITILSGRASVQYPIVSILAVNYLDRSLGGVTANGKQITTARASYGYAEIIYLTRSTDYRVTSAVFDSSLFVLTENT